MEDIQTQTWVVKLGTAVVTDGGSLSPEVLRGVALQVQKWHALHIRVIIVSSGAVACGSRFCDRTSIRARASLGQPDLIQHYTTAFAGCGLRVAQVLITESDTKYGPLLSELLELGVVPVVTYVPLKRSSFPPWAGPPPHRKIC